MNYQETLDYLDRLIRSGIKLGLDNTARLLDALGNPQLKVPTIHIAGTNGKGSTAIFSESILRAAGYRTGLYTSPHLFDFRERIQVNRLNISPEDLAPLATRVRSVCEQNQINATYFEFGTVLAFLHFFESGCQWNVIEVGMGGRLDSTNLCQAQVMILTSISRDHESSLGTEPVQIAAEKAGIIKPGGTVIAGSMEGPVMDVIHSIANKADCPVFSLGRDFKVKILSRDSKRQIFNWSNDATTLSALEIQLAGEFQVENAALAIAATRQALQSQGTSPGENAIRTGLNTAKWPGRIEVVGRSPLLVLDCAHNPDSVNKLTRAIRDHFKFDRCLVILGIMQDKDLLKVVETIGTFADEVILTQPKMERSADPNNLLKLMVNFNKVIEIIEEIPYALETAKNRSGPHDLVLVTGSVFTVAEAKQIIDPQTID